jgi:hypothetical protein
MLTKRTKHIDVRYHFVHDVIKQGLVKVCKISTYDDPTNKMTKMCSSCYV